jgi:phage tail sheath gpL-like
MATLQIPITGIGPDWRVPGGWAEILFAQGPASASVGEREVVFVMPMLSTGTWTAATLYKVGTASDAETGGGSGSPIHRGIRKFMSVNKDAKVYALPVAETSGGSPVAGTTAVTFTTTPTARGTATVTILGEDSSYTYSTSDTVTTVADGVKDAINAKPWLPVTATNSSGVLTLTNKLKGISQGDGTVPVISVRAAVTTGTGISVASAGAFMGATVAGAEGSTTEAAKLATALTTIDAVRKYYIVVSAYDATSLGNLKTHIQNKSEPRRGLRSVGIAAYPGTETAAATIATGRNYERLQLLGFENPDNDCAEIAGAIAAIRQKEEAKDATVGLFSLSLTDILNNPYNPGDWWTDTEQNDAINDGVAPIIGTDKGPVWVMNINTRSKNSAGTQDDFRATECHRVSGCDLFVDEQLADWALNMAGKKLEADEVLPNGKPNPNQTLRPGVIRASTFRPNILAHIDDFYSRSHLQNLAATKESVRVVKTGSRLECGLNLNIIDHALQSTFKVSEVSTG